MSMSESAKVELFWVNASISACFFFEDRDFLLVTSAFASSSARMILCSLVYVCFGAVLFGALWPVMSSDWEALLFLSTSWSGGSGMRVGTGRSKRFSLVVIWFPLLTSVSATLALVLWTSFLISGLNCIC